MSANRANGLLTRGALLAFPRRFRASMATDLLALYEDFEAHGRPHSRFAMIRDLLRNGLAARIDDAWGLLNGRTSGGPEHRPSESRRLETVGQDIAFALRMMRKSPVFTMLAVGSLAIGIGANTAVFTLLDATILRVLPVRDPHQLAVLHVAAPPGQWPDISTSGWQLRNDAGLNEGSSVSYAYFERIRDADTPFQAVTAFAPIYRMNVGVAGATELANGQVTAGNYYDMLGVRPELGRLLGTADDDRAAPAVMVISYGYWQRRFGGAQDILGTQVRLNGTPFTLVGVTDRSFAGALQLGDSPDVTVPLAHQAAVMRGRNLLDRPDYWWLRVMGRFESGAALQQAEAAMNEILARTLEVDLQETESHVIARVVAGARGMTEARSEIVRPMMILTAVVVAVLLIACVNLANLMLARASSRTRELAVRMSIGASRARVMRQLLSESLLLSGAGALLGTLLAFGLRDLLLPVLDLGRSAELGLALNWRVLVFTVSCALLTGLLFGIVPALRATGVDLTPALKDEPQRVLRGRLGLARSLLVVQVGMSLVLLVVAGLFTGTLVQLRGEGRGFDGEGVLVAGVDPLVAGYEGEALAAFYQELLVRVRQIPAVASAGLAQHTPAGGSMSRTSMRVEGYKPAEGEQVGTFINMVDAGFFAALGIEARQGRVFDSRDGAGTYPVAVVSRALVERYLPGANPLGRSIGLGGGDNTYEVEIIGVVDDIKYQNLRDRTGPAVHVLYSQHPERLWATNLTLRAVGPKQDLVPALRAALRKQDPDVSLTRVATQREMQRRNIAAERAFAQLSVTLSAVALLLSCIGLYGVLSYNVARRTREIGVRMALGARSGDVVRLVMGEMRTVGVGATVGLAAAFFAARSLESMLFGLEPADPRILAGATAILLTVATVAALLPARQAARLDPMESLRSE